MTHVPQCGWHEIVNGAYFRCVKDPHRSQGEHITIAYKGGRN